LTALVLDAEGRIPSLTPLKVVRAGVALTRTRKDDRVGEEESCAAWSMVNRHPDPTV